ncbi:MAG: DUF5711 family protein [Oscillospiraceae bacterium]
MDKRDDINRFRRKRAARRFAINIAVFVVIIAVVAVIAANWGNIIAPLKDAALDVGKGGFPVDLPGSTDYVLDELGDNFCLLTDTYFYTYNSEGAMIANVQHGLQNPAMSSNSRRALIYDRNGRDMKFYSRSGEVYTRSTEDTIDFAEISNSERCAVVTKSEKYTNCLYVFNGEGKQIFRWASPLYLIDRVEFSDDDNSIFASVCGAQNGELEYYILRFDLDNAEGSIWQTFVGSHMVFSLDYSSKGIFAVTAGGAKMLDRESGEITAETSFVKSVSQIPKGDIRAVLLKDSGGGEVLTVYDDTLEAAAAVSFSDVTRVRCTNGRLYVLSGRTLTQYDGSLNEKNSQELDDDYSDMIIIGGKVYLLGYNIVQMVEV